MITGKGLIDRIDDGVGWGSLDNGQTFDLPIFDHVVGDEVLMMVPAPEDDSEYDRAYCLAGETKLTIIFCQETDEGFEIVDVQDFPKISH